MDIAFSIWSLIVTAGLLWVIKKLWHLSILGTSDPNYPAPLPEGEFGWPIIGQTLHMLFEGTKFYERNFAKFGRVFKTHLFLTPTVRIYGPDNIAKILQGENDIVVTKWPTSAKLLLGDYTLAMSEGVDHNFMKKRTYAAFNHTALNGYAKMIQELVRGTIEKWCDQGEVLAGNALKFLLFRISADVICGFHYKDDEDARKLCEEFDVVSAGVVSIPFNLPFTAFGKAMRTREIVKQKLAEILRKKANMASEEDNQDAMRILIDIVKKSNPESYEQLYDTIGNQAIEFLITGVTSQCSGATMLVYNLARNPKVLKKVRDELNEHGLLSSDQPLTLEKINQCRYVLHVVKESLRISPPIGAGFRTAIKTFELDGKQIPKGWSVFYSIRETIHLSGTFTDSHKFDPDRFSSEREEDVAGGRYSMPVFGQGPRSCIGKNFALLALRILVIEMARMCDFEIPNSDNMEFAWLPAPMPKCGMLTRFRRLTVTDQNENELVTPSPPSSGKTCQDSEANRVVGADGVTERSRTCQAA